VKVILLARFSPRPLPPAPTENDLKYHAEECKKNSCDRQLEEMRAWCIQNKHDVMDEFREDRLSGDDAEKRPKLTEALAACKRGYMLLCRDFQRISRNAKFLMYTATDLSARNVTLFSLTEGKYEHDDDELWLSFGVRALFGEYYRRKTKKRTKKRMIEHQANNRCMSKQLPYGKMHDEHGPRNGKGIPMRMVDCPEEQIVIKRIIAAHEAGGSLREIARQLDADGMLCRGRPWGHKTIANILRRARVATT